MNLLFRRAVILSMLVSLLVGCSQRSDRVVAVAVHPTKPNLIYVVTEEAVYKTRDGGQAWTRLAEGLRRVRVMNLVIDPQLPANVFAGTLADGVYKSPDGGRRWLPRNAGIQKGTISANVNQLVFDPRDAQILYAATTVGVFQTRDAGQSWTERMQGMTEINFVVALAIDPIRPNILYAGTSGGVYRSIDGADHWIKANHGLVPEDTKLASMALGVNRLLIDPDNPDVVYAGTTRGVFKTLDRGETWMRLAEDLGELYVSSLVLPPGQHLLMGTSRGIFQSRDGGKTWRARNEGLANRNIRAIAMDSHDPRVLYAGTNGSGLFRSLDGGESWAHIPLVTNQ